MFTVNLDYEIQQPLSQFFVSQLINLEWVQPEGASHTVYPAHGDIDDGAGHQLITGYAVQRPDGQWSVMIVNRDQFNSHRVRIDFDRGNDQVSVFAGQVSSSTFGSGQYLWHPARTRFIAHAEKPAGHPVVPYTAGLADPDGPILRATINATKDTQYDIPAASVVVFRGKVSD
jgi:hypothetical protein